MEDTRRRDLNALFTVKSRRGCVRVATKNENRMDMAASHSFWYNIGDNMSKPTARSLLREGTFALYCGVKDKNRKKKKQACHDNDGAHPVGKMSITRRKWNIMGCVLKMRITKAFSRLFHVRFLSVFVL